MPFEITPNVYVKRDKQGVVRLLRHLQQPYRPVELVEPTPRTLAAAYFRDVAEIYGIDPKMLRRLGEKPGEEIQDEGNQFKLAHEKTSLNTTVVSFQQTHLGLPIWQAGFAIRMHGQPLRVTSSQSSTHYKVEVTKPKPGAQFVPRGEAIQSLLKTLANKTKSELLRITKTRLLIHRYDPDIRLDPESKRKGKPLEAPVPTLPLPTVPRIIRPKQHYVVTECLFTLSMPRWGELNWRAFLEVETGAVLYLRAFVASAFGNVFTGDVFAGDGGSAPDPCSPATTLDPLTTVVNLQGLTPPVNPGDPQALTGEFAELQHTDAPAINPPTAALPSGNFSFSAVTDDFAAVNAYHHVNALFRMAQSLGFNIGTYFDGTTFPVSVDHRGENGNVNAHAHGNVTGDGMGRFRFGLISGGCPVGIAADVRVVLHEFGHTLLWDNIHSPNFGFAHSMGDSLAAILNDPGSTASDRFETFPWVTAWNPGIDRRHDRNVTLGWAWGGTMDNGGYDSEQILSTTLFRIYRSTGGDSNQINNQRFAARYLVYLILQAVGSLATNPITPTNNPDVFATALMDADTGTLDFNGHPGGAFHKVIRWGFEQQGLYQPTGTPTPVTGPGAPPDVDVYIDDGRNGEYQYQQNFWNTQDIWNRLNADGGTIHETPVVGVTNYLYVRVRNRGTQTANNVVVKAYHCRPATGLVWPDDWKPMATSQLLAGPIPSSGATIVGPFHWTPEVVGHECLLAIVSATGDMSNADTASGLPSATGPIPHWRLVPFDNNIGQRNVAPVPGGGGSLNLALAFVDRTFWVCNPKYDAVRVKLEPILPDFLRRRKWELVFLNPGGSSFKLGPRASRKILLKLKPGDDFSTSDVEAAGEKAVIEVITLLDGIPVGGMTYRIDPKLTTPARETVRPPPEKDGYVGKISEILYDCFGDFEGFILDLCPGRKMFKSKEKEVEEIVKWACCERITVTVYTHPDDKCRFLRIGLHCE